MGRSLSLTQTVFLISKYTLQWSMNGCCDFRIISVIHMAGGRAPVHYPVLVTNLKSTAHKQLNLC
jgi:hypothetical protein